MPEADTKLVVMHIVEKVFIPDLMVVVHGFMHKAIEQTEVKKEWLREVGFAPAMPPVVLDLRDAQEHLASSIATALKEREPKQ